MTRVLLWINAEQNGCLWKPLSRKARGLLFQPWKLQSELSQGILPNVIAVALLGNIGKSDSINGGKDSDGCIAAGVLVKFAFIVSYNGVKCLATNFYLIDLKLMKFDS